MLTRPKSRIERYRSRFLAFNVLNSISFMLLSGNIPTLFALNMGATGTYIGLLGALNFITYFFMPLGRRAIQGRRIVGVFGWSWMFRYWGMIPALAAPFLARAGYPAWGLALLLAGSSGLQHLARRRADRQQPRPGHDGRRARPRCLPVRRADCEQPDGHRDECRHDGRAWHLDAARPDVWQRCWARAS